MYKIVFEGVDLTSATAIIKQIREDYSLNIQHPFIDENGVDIITFIGSSGIRKIIDSNYEELIEQFGEVWVECLLYDFDEIGANDVMNYLINKTNE